MKNASTAQRLKKNGSKKLKTKKQGTISKINESYNMDKAPDTLTSNDEMMEYRTVIDNDKRSNLQDIQSESSSLSKVRKNF